MKLRIAETGGWLVQGYGIEVTVPEYGYNAVRERLYAEYDKHAARPKGETFVVAWYTDRGKGHVYWMVGEAVSPQAEQPPGALRQTIYAASYAVVDHDPGDDLEKAWTADFYEVSHAVDLYYEGGIWFEHYPEGLDGPSELWMRLAR
ncbi:MAG: GyrI-like domain-containing protein [Propionibacteriaceae bacterium]|jgi:predicted transcriptional regulator YdeE|nr:GyrI-like domain-containing protein [Propionibacteriaceae bacterium]